MTRGRGALALSLMLGAAACGSGGDDAGGGAAAPAQSGDVAKGRTVYLTNCTACHNSDPSVDGTLGPAVAGASRELVEARVVRGTYPPGYTPKRPTQQMVPLPHLAPAVPDLAAFLAAAKPAAGG
jgi:mono/diheme cytochrome c family protein